MISNTNTYALILFLFIHKTINSGNKQMGRADSHKEQENNGVNWCVSIPLNEELEKNAV